MGKKPQQRRYTDDKKHMKNHSISYVIREIQTKMRYHYIAIRKATIQNTDKSNAGKEVKQQKLSFIAWGECEMVQSFWKTVGSF